MNFCKICKISSSTLLDLDLLAMHEKPAGILWHPLGWCAVHCLQGHNHLGDVVVRYCQIIKHTICRLLNRGQPFKHVSADPSDGADYESGGDFFHGPMMLLWQREGREGTMMLLWRRKGREGGSFCTWGACWPPVIGHGLMLLFSIAKWHNLLNS